MGRRGRGKDGSEVENYGLGVVDKVVYWIWIQIIIFKLIFTNRSWTIDDINFLYTSCKEDVGVLITFT